MPRFAILEHDHPVTHWDLFLESEGTLRTWRLYERPVPNTPIRAEPAPDHRVLYLTYQGPVSGDRGTVSQWTTGEFEWVTDDATNVIVRTMDSSIDGQFQIQQLTSEWTFYWTPTSVASNTAPSTDPQL
jgi:hypothetical protein